MQFRCLTAYRSIRKDLDPLIQQLKTGNIIGDQLVGLNREVFKVRLTNSDIRKGKNAGYRVVYYIKTKTSKLIGIQTALCQLRQIPCTEGVRKSGMQFRCLTAYCSSHHLF